MSLTAGAGRNRTITVKGLSSTTTDSGGQPIYTLTTKGTVKGRIDPKVRPDEVNGPDLNPVISEYKAIITLPSGFTVTERDTLTDADATEYEVLGVGLVWGRNAPHHIEIDLRRVIA